MSDTPSVGTLTHFANHGNIKSVPLQFEFQGTLIGGSEQVCDEHRRENRNYLVGAYRTFDLAGSLAPIGAPLASRGWFQLDQLNLTLFVASQDLLRRRERNISSPIFLSLALHRWRIRIFDLHISYAACSISSQPV
jgi:hypothetical protein